MLRDAVCLCKAFFGVVTGGDAGEGLDLCGTFEYAVCAGNSCGGGTISDATFTHDKSTDGFAIDTVGVYNHVYTIAVVRIQRYTKLRMDRTTSRTRGWAAVTLATRTPIRHSRICTMASGGRARGAAFTVDMDVTVDTVYRLQMLFQEKGCQRGWDITVEGTVIAENISPLRDPGR